MAARPLLERKVVLRRIQSAHSLAMARWSLVQLIAKPDFKLAPVETALPFQLGDVEFPVLLLHLIRHFVWDERRCREDELQTFDDLQLMLESLIGVNGKTSRRDLQPGTGPDRLFEIVAGERVDIVDDFHSRGILALGHGSCKLSCGS